MAVLAATAGLCAVPLSIAVTESFLAVALVARVAAIVHGRAGFQAPRVFWFWLAWAVLEVAVWLHSPRLGDGVGEIRHLLLIGALFVIVPALSRPGDTVRVWRGIFVTATLGSLALVAGFAARAIRYRAEILAGGDPGFYLRNGGFLHHWMIYSVVEIVVFGALLEFRWAYPEERWWTQPALGIHCLAIVLSLTRMLWLACLLVFGLHLAWRRSKAIRALAVAPAVVLLLAAGPLRQRMAESFQADYYANAERAQMWRVGWRMIRERPLAGVGPGRVETLYPVYLPEGEPLPAYHGHLHDNALQLAAQFGLPVLGAATLCLAILFRDLLRASRRARDRESCFVSRSAVLGLTGFLITGLTDYTYGHSLGLILLSFAVLNGLSGNITGAPFGK